MTSSLPGGDQEGKCQSTDVTPPDMTSSPSGCAQEEKYRPCEASDPGAIRLRVLDDIPPDQLYVDQTLPFEDILSECLETKPTVDTEVVTRMQEYSNEYDSAL